MNTALYMGAHRCCAVPGTLRQPVLIVFDLDGTLTDSRLLGRMLFRRVFALMGYGQITEALADSFNGPSADEVCRIMGIGPDRRPLYNQLMEEIEPQLVREIGKPYPGAAQMLASLSTHAAVAVLTNGMQAYLEACLDCYGFRPYVSLSSGYVSGVSKAERIGLWRRETGANRVIAVGDRGTDVRSAREAGAFAVGVTYGMGTREELREADVLCDDIGQVTRACMRILTGDAP